MFHIDSGLSWSRNRFHHQTVRKPGPVLKQVIPVPCANVHFETLRWPSAISFNIFIHFTIMADQDMLVRKNRVSFRRYKGNIFLDFIHSPSPTSGRSYWPKGFTLADRERESEEFIAREDDIWVSAYQKSGTMFVWIVKLELLGIWHGRGAHYCLNITPANVM